jgi:hypothetical protein
MPVPIIPSAARRIYQPSGCSVFSREVAAMYRDGVLCVTLPKTDQSKRHKIKVKS